MSRVIAEVHWDQDRPFRVIPVIPTQAREIATLELEHDLADEEKDAMSEVDQIFDRALALQSDPARPLVIAVEDKHVTFFDEI